MSVRFADDFSPEPAYNDGGDPTTWAQVVEDESEDEAEQQDGPLVTERQIQEEGLEKLASIFDVPIGGYADPLGVDHTSSATPFKQRTDAKKKSKKRWWGRRKSTVALFQADEGEDLRMGGTGMPAVRQGRRKSLAKTTLADEAAITPTEETFSPNVYLARVHRNTGYKELNSGLQMLEKDLKSKTANMRDYVAENFDHFITCIITLDSIQASLARETSKALEGGPGGASGASAGQDALTAPLSAAFAQVKADADHLYKDLLDRHEDAERIRRALDTLQRFDYLFALPGKIKACISNEDYDQVVRLYRRAQSLRNPSSPVVEKVITQVFDIVSTLCTDLLARLKDLPLFSEPADRIICHLIALDSQTDPALHHLTTQHEQTVVQLRGLTDTFKQNLQVQKNKIQTASDPSDARNAALALVAQFVYQITTLLHKSLATMWHFAEAIAGGKYNDSQQNVPENHGIDHVCAIIQDILESYSKRVRWSLFGDSSTRLAMFPAMYHAVLLVGDFLDELDSAGIPDETLKKLSLLNDEISKFWVRECCKTILKEISCMYAYPGTATQSLPQRFQSVLTVSLRRLANVVRDNQALKDSIFTMVASACKSFADTLHQLLMQCAHNGEEGAGPAMDPSVEHSAQVYLSPEDARIERDMCVSILNILRDVIRTRDSTIPEVSKLLDSIFGQHLSPEHLEAVTTVYDHAREIVISSYIQRKTVALESIILSGVLLSGTDYTSLPEPTTVRDYVMEIVLELTLCHDELQSCVPEETSSVIESLVVNIAHHFDLTAREVLGQANAYGVLQMHTEQEFIRRALLSYETDRSDRAFQSTQRRLQRQLAAVPNASTSGVDIDDLVSAALASCSLQLACFAE